MTTESYFAGGDIQVYIGPRGTTSYHDLDPIDATSVTLIEDGQVMPLYDYVNHLARHFAFSTRLVSGAIEFNYSANFENTHRQGSWADPLGYQHLHGATMWVVLTNVEWWPETKVVRDVIRIDHVWEHAFQHTLEPIVSETVPFTGRTLAVVSRRTRRISAEEISGFTADPDRYILDRGKTLRQGIEEINGTVVKVIDGDTYYVEPAGGGELIQVRLVSVAVPEDPWKIYYDREAKEIIRKDPPCGTELTRAALDAAWVSENTGFWRKNGELVTPDATLHLNHEESRQSTAGWERPTTRVRPTRAELDLWGRKVTCEVRTLLEGKAVRLVAPLGQAPVDKYKRSLLEVHLAADDTDVSEWLITRGYATVFDSTTLVTYEDGEYYSRSARLQEIAEQARALAGSDEAKGIWASTTP
jgi:endonuclease YncB( thermonuclease family)